MREGWPVLRELELIARIRAGAASRNGAVKLGIGDDCAVLRVPAGHEMVVTTDFSLEGRHFRRDWHSAESAGHRCLARGLSDVAAMGAKPVAAFLSLALPKGFDTPPRSMEPNEMGHPAGMGWVDGFMAGFNRLAGEFGVELAGGDTAEAPGDGVLADVMVVGAVRRGRALRRSAAREGDGIYVTGRLGGSAVELAALVAGEGVCPVRANRFEHPQTFPVPRVAVGMALVRRGGTRACMDLSDGLSTDLRHLCEASGVGAEIEAARIPLAYRATLEQGLHGGEDYELLFTTWRRVPAHLANVKLTRIGRVVAEPGVRLDGVELAAGGWEHFGG